MAPGRYCRGRRDVATMSAPAPPQSATRLYTVFVFKPQAAFFLKDRQLYNYPPKQNALVIEKNRIIPQCT